MTKQSKKTRKIRTCIRGEERLFIMPAPQTWPHGSTPCPQPLTIEDAANLTGYSLATVRRWSAGQPMPLCAFRLLMLHAYGLMPWADESWRGFRVRHDRIVTPDGTTVTARDLSSLRFLLQHRHHLADTVRLMRSQVATLETELRYSQIPLIRE